jgi:hypothetical protein
MLTIELGNMNDHIASKTRAHKGDQVVRKLVIKEKRN